MTFSGPQFLGVYAAIALLANWWLRHHYRSREANTTVSRLDFSSDPYQMAFLRKGDEEATNVVIFSLVDRGLLEEADGKVRLARADARDLAKRPIERAVLDCFTDWAEPKQALRDTEVRRACRKYSEHLVRHRLLAGPSTYSERRAALLAALGLTVGIAALRLLNAVLHGRHNVGFLIFFALICATCLLFAYRRRLTGLGEDTLERLQRLFAGLKMRADRVLPGGATHDAAVLAALFGIDVLPAASFPYVSRLFKKPAAGDSGGDGGSGGSGSGDGDGGGCGGGGCGGGCGG